MRRDEELKKLAEVCDFFCTMTNDEFFDYFYKNSPSFKKDFENNVSAMAHDTKIEVIER